MKKMNPVVHFEMPADDSKRMSDFYSNVFGWQMTGEEMGNYVTATTTETDAKTGRPTIPAPLMVVFIQNRMMLPISIHRLLSELRISTNPSKK